MRPSPIHKLHLKSYPSPKFQNRSLQMDAGGRKAFSNLGDVSPAGVCCSPTFSIALHSLRVTPSHIRNARTGVVDQDIETTKGFYGLGNCITQFCGVGAVCLDGKRPATVTFDF